MDSKIVNEAICNTIRPVLKEAGFSRFTPRNAWRYTENRVEVINFQSFNKTLAESVGCTTYSFSVNLGSYLLEIPQYCGAKPIKEKGGQLAPEEFECHLRGRLHRGFYQWALKRRDIWYIDPEGKVLDRAMKDVRKAINRVALPWFEKLRDTNYVLQILREQPEDDDRLFGFGKDPSPMRSMLTGYAALALGQRELAARKLTEVLDSESFRSITAELARDIEACGPGAAR